MVYINRIRFSLAGFFIFAVLSAMNTFPAYQLVIYLVGIAIMILAGLVQQYITSLEKMTRTLGKALVIVDIFVVWGVVAGGLFNGSELAGIQIKAPTLYVVFFFSMIYSSFVFSPIFTLSVTFLNAILQASLLGIAYTQGIRFEEELGASDKPGVVQPSIEVLKILFTLALGSVLYFVNKLLIIMKNAVQEELAESEKGKIRAENSKEKVQSIGEILSESVKSLNQALRLFNDKLQTQAASVEEISASMEEFSASLTNSEENVKTQFEKVESISKETDRLEGILGEVSGSAEFISGTMNQSRESGEMVVQSMVELDGILKEINQSFQKVSEVNQIMSEIADRTNLLALNASIEAARAGEHGRGFAVVAQEVAKLADNSAENASTIEKIIKQAAGLIKKGTESASQTGSRITEQQSGYTSLNDQIINLTKKIREQKDINNKVLQALKEIRSISQEIELNAREQSMTSSQVTQAIGNLDSAVSELAENSQYLQETIDQIENQAASLSV